MSACLSVYKPNTRELTKSMYTGFNDVVVVVVDGSKRIDLTFAEAFFLPLSLLSL
jgi:hypothetical protein